MTAETFPQHAVKPPKTTPADIVRRAVSPEQMLAHLTMAFPDLTPGEVVALIEAEDRKAKEELAALEPETKAMEAIEELVAPVMQGHPDMRLSEALEVLARQGNEQAAALLAQIDGAEARLQAVLLDKAVAADPYWEKTKDGTYRVRAGATYQTPEQLVEAYVKSRGDRLVDDIPADLLECFGRQELERVEGKDGKPRYRRRRSAPAAPCWTRG